MRLMRTGLGAGVCVVIAVAGCTSSDETTPGPEMPGNDAGNDASVVDSGNDVSVVDSGNDASAVDSGEAGPDGGLVARGDYVMNHVFACGDCHTPRKADGSPDVTRWLAGSPGFFQVPGLGPDGGVGIVSPPNLTPDPTTGIGNWTDAQIKAAFLTGVDDQGKALFNIMPYYVLHNMSSADADAIVAYLRSIPPISQAIPDRNFDVPAPSPAVPAASIPNPTLPTTDPRYASAMAGKYLAGNIGGCMECHTKHVQTPGVVPIDLTMLFAGGEPFPSAALHLPTPPFPDVIFSQNVTPDTTGLSGWVAQDIVTELLQGHDKAGDPVCPPMPVGPLGAFGGLTPDDALNIANYILSLPPKSNTVPQCVLSDAGTGDAAPEGGDAAAEAGDAGVDARGD